jgi:hypothetical protein
MRKSRFTEEQIIKLLKEHAAGVGRAALRPSFFVIALCQERGFRRAFAMMVPKQKKC